MMVIKEGAGQGEMGKQGLTLWPVGVKHCGHILQTLSVKMNRGRDKRRDVRLYIHWYKLISLGFHYNTTPTSLMGSVSE